MNAIILHGKPSRAEYYSLDRPSPSNSHWLPWLQAQLLRRGIVTQNPEMPDPWQPHYGKWCDIFQRQLINDDTILIGHSCGGGFIVQWLSQHTDIRVGHIVLVAPSLGDSFFPGLPPYEYPLQDGFFDFIVDSTIAERCKTLSIIHSSDDRLSVQKTVAHLREKFTGHRYVELRGFGHFTETKQIKDGNFVELLEEIDQVLSISSAAN